MKITALALLAVVKAVSAFEISDLARSQGKLSLEDVEGLQAALAHFEEEEKIKQELTALEKELGKFDYDNRENAEATQSYESVTVKMYSTDKYLYANKDSRWRHGIGFSLVNTDAVTNWNIILQDSEESADICGDKDCYFFQNEESNRCLYAMPDESGSNGVGADTCNWYSNHWLIDSVNCDDEVCYTFENAYSNRTFYADEDGLGAEITEDATDDKYKFVIPGFYLVYEQTNNCSDEDSITLEECSDISEAFGRSVCAGDEDGTCGYLNWGNNGNARPKGCFAGINYPELFFYNPGGEEYDGTLESVTVLCKKTS